MTFDLIAFIILALVAIVSALGMLLSKNAVYSALFLILNFVTIALFYLLLGAPFLAMIQVTVYAGAIMVLFLFVIMLLGVESLRSKTTTLSWQQPVAIALAVILLVEAVYVIFIRFSELPQAVEVVEGFGSPKAVGEVLFNKYLLPFEVTSILLLVAIVGAILLTMRQRTGKKYLETENIDGTD